MGSGHSNTVRGLTITFTLLLTLLLTHPTWAKNTRTDTPKPASTTDTANNTPGDTPSADAPTEPAPATAEQKPADTQKSKTRTPKKEDTARLSDTTSTLRTMSAATAGTAADPTTPGYQSIPIPEISVFTAAANYRIPIKIPTGRNGLTPDINLIYNSYLKNGWLGVGWTLDMGAIQRSTKFGLNYNADDFVFTKNGSSEELVARPDWGADHYGAKIEGGFAKYKFDTANNTWIVTDKNGTKYYYGQTAASRQDDPADQSRVFKWCLDRVQDPHGNYMTLTYTENGNRLYLYQIDYTGHDPSNTEPANSVNFIRTDRDDITSTYTAHYEVQTAQRLMAIRVAGHANQTVRVYAVDYQYSAGTGRSLINKVQQYGYDAIIDFCFV